MCAFHEEGTLFAKSSDRPVGEVQLLERHPVRGRSSSPLATQYLHLEDAGAAGLVGSRPVWLWGLEHGVNDHRVAIGNEKVWTTADGGADHPGPPALIGMDLVRLGLERGTSAAGAVDAIVGLIDAHGQAGVCAEDGDAYSSSFLVADPIEAWIVDTRGDSWAAQRAGPDEWPGLAISNRLNLGRGWDRASADVVPGCDIDTWRPPDEATGHADRRRAVTGRAVGDPSAPPLVTDGRPEPEVPDPPGQEGSTVEHRAATLVAALRSHGGPGWGPPDGTSAADVEPVPPAQVRRDGTGVTVCMHIRDYQATAASTIAWLPRNPDDGVRLWHCLGSPCIGVFVPVLPSHVPSALGDRTLWRRFDHLRRRVEEAADSDPDGGRGALEAVRAVTGPLESELWADAAGAARRGDERRAADAAAAVGPRLAAALDQLAVPTG